MRTSSDGNLKEIVIRDKEAIYVLSLYAQQTRRTPGNAATHIILESLKRLRPADKNIPPNRYWQLKNRTKAKAADQNAAAGQEKGADNGE